MPIRVAAEAVIMGQGGLEASGRAKLLDNVMANTPGLAEAASLPMDILRVSTGSFLAEAVEAGMKITVWERLVVMGAASLSFLLQRSQEAEAGSWLPVFFQSTPPAAILPRPKAMGREAVVQGVS